MPTQTTLQSGLGGAIGSDFRRPQNQLIFVEYATGKLSGLTVAPATPAYTVLGTGYNQPEDVKLSVDGIHAYITERTGDLVRVSLTSANRSAATVIATGLNAPQQLFLDEAHNAAYVVEYAAAGDLVRINLTGGAKTVVATGLNNPVGVVLTANGQYAYVTEQTTGPDLGRVSQIQISSGVRTTIAKGLTAPFFLTWADPAQDSLLVPQRDPSNSIARVYVTSGVTSVIATGVPFRPSSVVIPYLEEVLVCCDSVIDAISFVDFTGTALLMGIGNIPYNYINTTTGLATTPSASIYYVNNAPFGGTLSIMVNFQAADTAGAPYYQVLVDGVPQTSTWLTYKYASTPAPGGYVLTPVPATIVGPTIGCYPVHPVADLFLYYPPALGYILDTTALTNGFHTIQLQLISSTGAPVAKSLLVKILVNNQSCVATLSPVVLSTSPPTLADACGVLHYGTNKALTVTLAYTATQPAGFGLYSFDLVRGVTGVTLTPPLPDGAPVPATAPITATVSQLLGTCPTAGFAAEIYVAATMTNGWNRQSQYDAWQLMGFVLTP
jgi:hypothetical protein